MLDGQIYDKTNGKIELIWSFREIRCDTMVVRRKGVRDAITIKIDMEGGGQKLIQFDAETMADTLLRHMTSAVEDYRKKREQQ